MSAAARPRRRVRRVSDVALATALLVALLTVVARLNTPDQYLRAGAATVYDGDTMTVSGEKIRLKGIDAPELRQTCRRARREYPCGRRSRDALVELVGARGVSCRATGRDRYRRLLGECTIGGVNLNAAQVRAGWAVAYGRGFETQEAEARRRSAGMWAGTFDEPQAWRRRHGDVLSLEYGPLAEWLVGTLEGLGLWWGGEE